MASSATGDALHTRTLLRWQSTHIRRSQQPTVLVPRHVEGIGPPRDWALAPSRPARPATCYDRRMRQTLPAMFENGVFRPLRRPTGLAEHREATLTVDVAAEVSSLTDLAGTLSLEDAQEMRAIVEREFERVDPRVLAERSERADLRCTCFVPDPLVSSGSGDLGASN